jgi:hypothetical protein
MLGIFLYPLRTARFEDYKTAAPVLYRFQSSSARAVYACPILASVWAIECGEFVVAPLAVVLNEGILVPESGANIRAAAVQTLRLPIKKNVFPSVAVGAVPPSNGKIHGQFIVAIIRFGNYFRVIDYGKNLMRPFGVAQAPLIRGIALYFFPRIQCDGPLPAWAHRANPAVHSHRDFDILVKGRCALSYVFDGGDEVEWLVVGYGAFKARPVTTTS